MEKLFHALAVFSLLISIIFSVSVMIAVAGYGNRMVMLWMVVGPLLYWLIVIAVFLYTLIPKGANKISNTEYLFYATISVSIGTFISLNLNSYNVNYLLLAFIVIASSLAGIWIAKNLSQVLVRNGIIIAAMIVAWFVNIVAYQVFVMVLLFSVVLIGIRNQKLKGT